MKPIRFLLAAFVLTISGQAASFADDLADANRMFKQGQQTPALVKVNAYLGKNPSDAQARFLKGLILTEMNRVPEAIKVFTDLSEEFPELPEPYNNLAVLYAAQGQYEKAKNSLEMAIRTHPSYATAHENLGDIYAKLASLAYDKALQLDKSNSTAQTKLSLIRELFTANGEASAAKPAVPDQAVAVAAVETPTPSKATLPKPQSSESSAPKTQDPEPTGQKVQSKQSENPKDELQNAVMAWAEAWSKQDVTKYLGFYGPEFKTPTGMSREDWEAQRKDRVGKPGSIEIDISNLKISMLGSNRAEMRFRQAYRSDQFKSRAWKTLIWKQHGDRWLILEERAR
jgi:tetratricopeptide (TPR) repeat protein